MQWSGRLAVIRAARDPSDYLLGRAALLKEAGTIVHRGYTDQDNGLDISDDILCSWIRSDSKFHIRTLHLPTSTCPYEPQVLIRQLGRMVQHVSGAEVSFDYESTRLLLVFHESQVLLCRSKRSDLRHVLMVKTPRRRKFFHPSMMNSVLARVMCNLARIRPGVRVLDPFCGAGGILCEAASIGAVPIGIDLNWRLLRGAQANLADIGSTGLLIKGDAQHIPLTLGACDAVVTDPPYGKVSSTRGSKSRNLVWAMLSQTQDILSDHGTICICGNKPMGLPTLVERAGLHICRVVEVPVHKQLTRILVVATCA